VPVAVMVLLILPILAVVVDTTNDCLLRVNVHPMIARLIRNKDAPAIESFFLLSLIILNVLK
jgi:hypothetical protein